MKDVAADLRAPARFGTLKEDAWTRSSVRLAEPSDLVARRCLPMVRLLLADDHRVVREGLAMMLTLDPELEVVGEAADGEEAVRLARELRPNLVLMDLSMPVLDGIAATAAIRRDVPGAEVLVLTSVLQDASVAAAIRRGVRGAGVLVLTSVLQDASVAGAIRAGAIGYLHKDTNGAELRRAVKAAAAGQVQLSPVAARWLVGEMHAGAAAAEPSP